MTTEKEKELFLKFEKEWQDLPLIKLQAVKKTEVKQNDIIPQSLCKYALTRDKDNFLPATIIKNTKEPEKRVSFGRTLKDLYRIMKYYYPKTTVHDVVTHLRVFNENNILASQFCKNVAQEWVFRISDDELDGGYLKNNKTDKYKL